jgi:hypothetical protein
VQLAAQLSTDFTAGPATKNSFAAIPSFSFSHDLDNGIFDPSRVEGLGAGLERINISIELTLSSSLPWLALPLETFSFFRLRYQYWLFL